MRKIYDCFTFFNELDLLEIRLAEHFEHVDYFVIAEANKSHQGFSKDFVLEKHWDRFKKYQDKIIYVKVEDMPDDRYSWTLENFQRDALQRGLTHANDNDVIVVSDCDEILRSFTFELLRHDIERELWICRQPIFWSKVNYFQIEPIGAGYNVNSMATTKKNLVSPQDLRNKTHWAFHNVPVDYIDNKMRTIQHAGWHFSYLGDDGQAKSKLENFAHTEARHLISGLNIQRAIEKGLNPISPTDPGKYAAARLDDYFPKTLLENQERWEHLIVPNGQLDIRKYYLR